MKCIEIIKIWFKIFVLKQKIIKGYSYKEWETGNCFTEHGYGYEIINLDTNKVVYRNGRYCQNLDSPFSTYEDISKFFPKNINFKQ